MAGIGPDRVDSQGRPAGYRHKDSCADEYCLGCRPFRDPGFSCSHDNDPNPCPSRISHDQRVLSLEQQRIEMETSKRQSQEKLDKTRRSLQSRCFKCDAPIISSYATSSGVDSHLCFSCLSTNPQWSGGDVERFLSHRWGEPVGFDGRVFYECSACHVWRVHSRAVEDVSPPIERRAFLFDLRWDGSSGCVEYQPQALAPALPERPRLAYPRVFGAQGVVVSAFIEGHGFARVEIHLRLGVDLSTPAGKLDVEKRRVLERIVERSIRAMDLDLGEVGRRSTDRVHGVGCPVDAPEFLGPCPGCGAEKEEA
jgi:hypothetical protein